MRQSRLMSFVEAVANVLVGYVATVLVQIVLFPMFGLVVLFGENLAIGLVFTAASIGGNGGAKVDQGSGVMVALRAA